MKHKKYNTAFYLQKVFIYEQDIVKFLFSYVKDEDIANDLKQNVMELSWKKLDQLKDAEKVKSWLFSIAYNEAMYYLKKRNKSLQYEYDDVSESQSIEKLEDEKENIVELLYSKYEHALVRKALEQTDEKYQDLLRLRYVEEFSLKEISEIKCINYNSLRVYIVRAVKQIRDIYFELEGEEDEREQRRLVTIR